MRRVILIVCARARALRRALSLAGFFLPFFFFMIYKSTLFSSLYYYFFFAQSWLSFVSVLVDARARKETAYQTALDYKSWPIGITSE